MFKNKVGSLKLGSLFGVGRALQPKLPVAGAQGPASQQRLAQARAEPAGRLAGSLLRHSGWPRRAGRKVSGQPAQGALQFQARIRSAQGGGTVTEWPEPQLVGSDGMACLLGLRTNHGTELAGCAAGRRRLPPASQLPNFLPTWHFLSTFSRRD